VVKLLSIYTKQDDGSIVGVDFEVSKEYAEKIEFDNNTNEVQSLPNVLYSQCEDIVNKKGYKLLDYFIYFFNDINVLSFEIEKI